MILAAAAGMFSAGARLQSYEARLGNLERDQVNMRSEFSYSQRDIMTQLKRIEISLAELRAEQRILHGR
jgi:hypothetical protein